VFSVSRVKLKAKGIIKIRADARAKPSVGSILAKAHGHGVGI
jgi:hypothetical protein